MLASNTRARGGGSRAAQGPGRGLVAGAAAGAGVLVRAGVGGVGGAGSAAQLADTGDHCRVQVGGPSAAGGGARAGHAGDRSPTWEGEVRTHDETGSGRGGVGIDWGREKRSGSGVDGGGRSTEGR